MTRREGRRWRWPWGVLGSIALVVALVDCDGGASDAGIDAQPEDAPAARECGPGNTAPFACGTLSCPRTALCAINPSDAGPAYRCLAFTSCAPYSCANSVATVFPNCTQCAQASDGTLTATCTGN